MLRPHNGLRDPIVGRDYCSLQFVNMFIEWQPVINQDTKILEASNLADWMVAYPHRKIRNQSCTAECDELGLINVQRQYVDIQPLAEYQTKNRKHMRARHHQHTS